MVTFNIINICSIPCDLHRHSRWVSHKCLLPSCVKSMLKLLSWLIFFLLPSTIRLLHSGVVALLYCEGVRQYSSFGHNTWKQTKHPQLSSLSHEAAVKHFQQLKGSWEVDRSAANSSGSREVYIHLLVVQQWWSGGEECCHTSTSVPRQSPPQDLWACGLAGDRQDTEIHIAYSIHLDVLRSCNSCQV